MHGIGNVDSRWRPLEASAGHFDPKRRSYLLPTLMAFAARLTSKPSEAEGDEVFPIQNDMGKD